MLDGIDLFAKDRAAVMAKLAGREAVYYQNGEDFFFPQAGVTLPNKKYARSLPYITLVEPTYQMERLDFEMYDPTRELSA